YSLSIETKFEDIEIIIIIIKTIVIGFKSKSLNQFYEADNHDIALLTFDSIISPNTNPSTIGATGYPLFLIINPNTPNISINKTSNVLVSAAYAPIIHNTPIIGNKCLSFTFIILAIKGPTVNPNIKIIILPINPPANIIVKISGVSEKSKGPGLNP